MSYNLQRELEGLPQRLEELEAACTLKDISKMPVRVKCAVLAWHTLDMILDRLGKDKKQ